MPHKHNPMYELITIKRLTLFGSKTVSYTKFFILIIKNTLQPQALNNDFPDQDSIQTIEIPP